MDFKAEKKDYEDGWNSTKTTPEQITALALGFKPPLLKRALDLYQNYYKQNGTVISYPARHSNGLAQNDIEFWDAFRKFCAEEAFNKLSPYTNILACLKNTSENNEYWVGGKKEFVWKIYACGLLAELGWNRKPHPDFVEFLNNRDEWPNEYDHYLSQEQYFIDPSLFDVESIPDAESTIAALWELTPEYFLKYRRIRKETGQPVDNDEDIFFLHAYHEVLGDRRDSLSSAYIATSVFVKERGYPEWGGNIKAYIQALYDHGVIFNSVSGDLIKRLFPDGLSYSEDCRTLKAYKRCIRLGSWDIDEALCFFQGRVDDKFHQYDMRSQEAGFTDFDNKTYLFFADEAESRIDIKDLAMRHIQAGTLKPLHNSLVQEIRFSPGVITKWLMENTQIEPPPALLQALDMDSQASSEVAITPDITSSQVTYANPPQLLSGRKRGRKSGDGQIQDGKHLQHMKELIDQQKAKSVNDAAGQTVTALGKQGASHEADVTRLSKKYAKQYLSTI